MANKEQVNVYKEIKNLAQHVLKIEEARGNTVKDINKMMVAGAKSMNKSLAFQKELGKHGQAWVDSIKDSNKNLMVHVAAKSKAAYDMRIQAGEVTTHTTEMSGLQGDILDSMSEIGKLEDESRLSLKEKIPYAAKIAELQADQETTLAKSADLATSKDLSYKAWIAAEQELSLLTDDRANGIQNGTEAEIEAAKAAANTSKEVAESARNAALENEERRIANEDAVEYFKTASKSKQLAEERKESMEAFNEVFGFSLKDIEKYGKKFKSFITSPMMIGIGVVGALAAVFKKFLISPIQDSMKLQKELGIGAGHAWDLQLASQEAAAGGFMYGESVSDSLERAKTLVDTWGVLNDETMRSIKIATDLERTYGISTDSAAGLAQMMEATSDSTKDVLMAGMAGEMKSMQEAGLPVGSIMTDIAGDTDFFAGHMKDGGKNIMKAAKFAKKLGMDMNTISSAAESLLDWESSINAEMEASVLLGRSVNMEQARQLMFEGKHEEAMKAIMVQVGSEADFAAMNVVQREALAAASGLSLTDLTKMVAAEQKLASMSVTERTAHEKRNKITGKLQKIFGGVVDMFREWYKRLMIPIYEKFQEFFDTGLGVSDIIKNIKESMEHIIVSVITWVQALDLPKIKAMAASVWDMVVGAKDLVKILWEHKGLLIAMASMWALNKMGLMSFVLDGVKALGKYIAQWVALKFAKDAANKPSTTDGTPSVATGDPNALIKGAAAMLIIAAALWVFAKALQEYKDVEWESIAMAGVTLLGMVVILKLLGKAKGDLIVGALAMGIMSLALIPFAHALNMLTDVDFSKVAWAGVTLLVLAGALSLFGSFLIGGGVILFGAGVLGLIALGGALIILGVGLMSIGKGAEMVTKLTAPLTSLVSIVGKIGLLALGFAALGASLGVLAIGAMLLYPALPALMALSALGMVIGGVAKMGKGDSQATQANQRSSKVEKEIKKTNDRLDSLISVIEKQANHEALKAISRKEISAIEGAFSNR